MVETSHFTGKWTFHGAGPNLRLVERWTRVSVDTLDYRFTVHDPESFAAPWTVAFPFTLDPGPIYEAACHEGNYSMSLMLTVARAQAGNAAVLLRGALQRTATRPTTGRARTR